MYVEGREQRSNHRELSRQQQDLSPIHTREYRYNMGLNSLLYNEVGDSDVCRVIGSPGPRPSTQHAPASSLRSRASTLLF